MIDAPPVRPGIQFIWNGLGDPADAAAFAGRIIGRDTAYISHGEIQTGLSPDGIHWAGNLSELYASDFADLEDRDLLVVRTEDGMIVAVAVVAWEETPRRKFAVLEDMVVDTDQRSGGIGSQVVEAIVERVRARGVEWIFLESGLRNTRAHAFFMRHGFEEISHVFGRRLDV
jgi:N-acetylglutamate synthase and related acetyltransferases